jgi:hypothetical protein
MREADEKQGEKGREEEEEGEKEIIDFSSPPVCVRLCVCGACWV